jgi:hypothetical protein
MRVNRDQAGRVLLTLLLLAMIYRGAALFADLPGVESPYGRILFAYLLNRPTDNRGSELMVRTRSFFLDVASQVPEDARMFLTSNHPLNHFYGTYLLYPRALLGPKPKTVLEKQEESVLEQVIPSYGWLAEHGIDAVIVVDPATLGMHYTLRAGRW